MEGGNAHRLSVRPMDVSDIDWFVGIRNQVRESLHDSRTFSVAEARAWFLDRAPDFRVIIVDDAPVGYFRLGPPDEPGGDLWIGADLDPAFHGRGIAGQAYRQFMPGFIEEFGARGAVLRVRPWNVPAMRLYRRLGFVTVALEVDAATPAVGAAVITDVTMRWPGPADAAPAFDAVDLLVAEDGATPG